MIWCCRSHINHQMELLLRNSNKNKNLLGIPYPESLELRKQCRKLFAEIIGKAVLIYVEMLNSLELRCNGVHLARAYGCSQCQIGHLGWKGFRIRGKKIPSYKERIDRTEVTETVLAWSFTQLHLKKTKKRMHARQQIFAYYTHTIQRLNACFGSPMIESDSSCCRWLSQE